MSFVILAIGILGVLVAGWFLVDLVVDAVRRREYIDVVVALAVVGSIVWVVVVYGDRLMR